VEGEELLPAKEDTKIKRRLFARAERKNRRLGRLMTIQDFPEEKREREAPDSYREKGEEKLLLPVAGIVMPNPLLGKGRR